MATVVIHEFIMAFLSFSCGRNLIKPMLSPMYESEAINPMTEMMALAIPTSAVEYKRAAIIQKTKPPAAPTAE